ncbi:MAG: hypothetical protein GX567_11095 [Clostridia bacterium]|nr:hypothetical protein [Clostridia bacterium]
MKPLLLGLLVQIPLLAWFLNTAAIRPVEYLAQAPYLPVIIFVCFITFFVGLSYYLGEKKILSSDMIGLLKDDAMI